MRTIRPYESTAKQTIEITVMDDPGPGGASHVYQAKQAEPDNVGEFCKILGLIKFQKGLIKEAGINGLTHEALLDIVVDRLESFQGGPFKCKENHEALKAIQLAIRWLRSRTKDRKDRDVEDTLKD